MNSTNDHRSTHRHDERGIAVIWVAVFLLVSLWFVSLAIDMGKLMAAKTELQAAADAAALAGASALDLDTGEIMPDSATIRATLAGGQNAAYEGTQTSVVVDPGDISFPAANQVRVIVRREAATGNPVLTHFAQTLGVPNLSVNADATAEAFQIGEPCEHLAPFAPENVPDSLFNTNCGTEYVLKAEVGKSQQGNFQLLELPDCNEDDIAGGGANAVQDFIEKGYQCCLKIGDEFLFTQPGAEAGPFQKGIDYRWAHDTDQRDGICYDDYTGNGSRVFVTPIIESFSVNGKKSVRIVKFAAFFLRDEPSNNLLKDGLKGQFIKYVVPGNAGPAPPEDSMIYGIHLVE